MNGVKDSTEKKICESASNEDRESRRYIVFLPNGDRTRVTCEFLMIQDGVATFYDSRGSRPLVVLAFAPGAWLSLSYDDDKSEPS